ncbi:MAG: sulfotransferase domain-containing protein [Nitrospira sp.]
MGLLNRVLGNAKRVVANRKRSLLKFTTPAWGVPNPKDSDVYLVSYPKSGNTWMRYLMAYAIWPDLAEIDLIEMGAYMPSVGLKNDSDMMRDPNSPCNRLKYRIIKEHKPYNQLARQYIKRAIYIARDGRDAMVSYWHFCNQRDGTAIPFSEFIELSAKPEHSYGEWRVHLMGWMNATLDAKLVLRYEDLIADTAGSLRQALEIVEVEVSEAALANAVERASFSSMRKLEKTKGFNLEMLKKVEFVREGKIGSWQDVFGPGDLERFCRFHGGCVSELGYSW